MSRQLQTDLEKTLAQLGLEEVEQRLEVSPLLATADIESLEREGYSCCCKIPPDPEEEDPDGGGV